jgi:ABC-type polysaccharide/polyol phosphate transport system ATPase subunit
MATIEIRNVWKEFRLHHARARTLKEEMVRRLLGRSIEGSSSFWALQDVSFDIERGETFGIIGSNGSGKSTLLKLMTGISKPTRGSVGVRGRVSALLELGAGFHPDFSGRENTYLNGAILGLNRREIDRLFDAIVSFAELEAFIDNPVKTYSSGMYMRLAFAIAIHVDPDILVVDEVLAVGDGAFQQKCYDQIHRFKHQGKTIVFVSHSLGTVQELCQRSAWLDKGHLRALGETRTVLDFYSQQIAEKIEQAKEQAAVLVPDGRAVLRNLRSVDEAGVPRDMLGGGMMARFVADLESGLPPDQLTLSARLVRADGVCCYDQRVAVSEFLEGRVHGEIVLEIPELRLYTGTYSLHLAVGFMDSDQWLDEKFFNFAVEGLERGAGVTRLEGSWRQVAPVTERVGVG